MVMVNSQGPLPGTDFSAPDVYLQMTPVGPVPVPFMSSGMRSSEIPGNFRFFVMCMPAHNLMSMAPVTISGPGPGAASGMVCSASRNIKGSSRFFICGMPATRMLDPTAQNGLTPNSVGMTILPSQVRLLNPGP